MYIYRNVPFEVVWRFGWKNILLFLVYGAAVCGVHYYFFNVHGFEMHIPFALIGPIGVAVAIYASFKNGQSYDRTWEARKNWGALAVATRIFANQLMMYVNGDASADIKICIDRQIAYLNALKLQLRKRSPHSRTFSKSIRKYYFGEPTQIEWNNEVASRMIPREYDEIQQTSNKALQILYLQNRHLLQLKKEGKIDEFKMMDMMENLDNCFENQGKNERLKSTPFPRQYAFFSKSFIAIFILILPFGILDLYTNSFKNYSLLGYTIICSLYTLVSWLYITIELVGDNSEDPFENFITDIPMNAICRNVEIDLYEMIKAPNIPEKIKDHNGILM